MIPNFLRVATTGFINFVNINGALFIFAKKDMYVYACVIKLNHLCRVYYLGSMYIYVYMNG